MQTAPINTRAMLGVVECVLCPWCLQSVAASFGECRADFSTPSSTVLTAAAGSKLLLGSSRGQHDLSLEAPLHEVDDAADVSLPIQHKVLHVRRVLPHDLFDRDASCPPGLRKGGDAVVGADGVLLGVEEQLRTQGLFFEQAVEGGCVVAHVEEQAPHPVER
uniref:Secreted protein n=1 Tax=Ixodes ricinus TaxID=34613 RepID=A0A6B0UXR1_IXORI